MIVGEIGSFAHGLNVPSSDHDYMGLYIDPAEALIGLKPLQGSEQDRDKPQGVKSEAGDKEATFYGVRKYAKHASDGNPTMMTLLFTPNLIVADEVGLQANRDMFLSKKLVDRHIGYSESMRRQLTGEKAPRTNRPELVAAHGFDTKAAFHALRLLIQGYEMLMDQTMTMPMEDGPRQFLLGVRHGEYSYQQVLDSIAWWRERIEWARYASPLPDEPDYPQIDRWLIDIHNRDWELQSTTTGESQ